MQVVVRDIMRGILKGDIDSRKGNLLLYATQISSNNLSRWKQIKDDDEVEEEPEEQKEPIMIKSHHDQAPPQRSRRPQN